MNKPFLPDDLLTTLRQAVEWKRSLKNRIPAGTLMLGPKDLLVCSKGINQMIADIFTRTELNDLDVAQIREAIETLAKWSQEWSTEHAGSSPVKLDYRITPAEGNTSATIEWTLSEATPGILTDAFFRPAAPVSSGGLMGWGAATLLVKQAAPVAPAARWFHVLAKTGAANFEKNSRNMTVRFTRKGAPIPLSPNGSVPVVEIDGTRYPTRLRDEALAAKRK